MFLYFLVCFYLLILQVFTTEIYFYSHICLLISFLNLEFYNNIWFISLIFLNVYIYIYLLLNLFVLLFMFDLKYFNSLSDLKKFNKIPFIHTYLVLIFLSLAGIPPLMGFLSKFLIFIYIFYKNNFFFFLIFICANMFIIYFYIQNLKFLVSKNTENFFLKNFKNNFYYKINNLLNLFNFFNILIFMYLEDFLIFINYVVSFLLI